MPERRDGKPGFVAADGNFAVAGFVPRGASAFAWLRRDKRDEAWRAEAKLRSVDVV